MEAKTLPVYNSEGKEVDTIKLDPDVFDGIVNSAAIYQVVQAYRMNQRRGLTSTKTRGEVSGGGRKPWRQKGTGRARVGSTRSPLWRHGGVVFGPHPRHFSYSVSHKLRRLALKSGLNAKVKEDSLVVLDTLSMEKPKTKEAAKIFKNLRVVSNKPKHALLLVDKKQKNLDLAVRNISFLDVNLAQNTNVYEVLAHAKLLVTREGLKQLIGRLKQ